MRTFIARYAGDTMPFLIRSASWADAAKQAEKLSVALLLSLTAATFNDDKYNMDVGA